MNIYTPLELFMKLKTNADTIKKTYIIKTQYFFPRISLDYFLGMYNFADACKKARFIFDNKKKSATLLSYPQ